MTLPVIYAVMILERMVCGTISEDSVANVGSEQNGARLHAHVALKFLAKYVDKITIYEYRGLSYSSNYKRQFVISSVNHIFYRFTFQLRARASKLYIQGQNFTRNIIPLTIKYYKPHPTMVLQFFIFDYELVHIDIIVCFLFVGCYITTTPSLSWMFLTQPKILVTVV
ncbi:hypothetical protein BDA99DRAFT_542266 [Phascolomyces articulosus]|uniref:Uncharacterized protein n=1 Tax=Phascolomyces articulosus TaxID=60185 RepID=A0AAD5P9D4_9FUNG|nr:hypothetical protein BDA99DRAFT_542266 [Phascolomyces articulosus]